jgi:hypothetical protein
LQHYDSVGSAVAIRIYTVLPQIIRKPTMRLRPLLFAAIATALIAPSMALDAKNPGRSVGVTNLSGGGSVGPDGTATLTVLVPVGGINTDLACGDTATPTAGNTVVSIGLGANAVVTGIGWAGGHTSFSPSWRSEVAAIFRGNTPAQSVILTPNGDDSSGVATYDIAPIDLTGAMLSNIDTGASGLLNIELCETFADASVTPDATTAAGSVIRVQCFNCVDPFAAEAVAAPSLNAWGMLGLMLGLGLIGGFAARRFS